MMVLGLSGEILLSKKIVHGESFISKKEGQIKGLSALWEGSVVLAGKVVIHYDDIFGGLDESEPKVLMNSNWQRKKGKK
jgi:hypothetical protein